ncbi:MAG: glycosyltransferase family 4 protein, partial [Nanoarchaeota archaeon]|nr:glycosyltransferase family 4 protein [Nanoarchaeota archaeon]
MIDEKLPVPLPTDDAAVAQIGGQRVDRCDRRQCLHGGHRIIISRPGFDETRLIARAGVALYHGTKNVLPWRCSVPAVVTVHDLAVYAWPETFAWPQRVHFRLCVPTSVARAARVIADSTHARDDLIGRFHLDPARSATRAAGSGAWRCAAG